MSEKAQLALIQLVGFVAVLIGGALALAIYLYVPALAALGIPLTTAIGWYVGKLIGAPLNFVTMKAAISLPPAETAELVTRIATSTPPAKMVQVLQSLAPAARERMQIILDDEAASLRPPPLTGLGEPPNES
jgi:hypothetical protein